VTYGSLFTGIGGFDSGFDRAGMECLWQCEIDTQASQVLKAHWPEVERFTDVKDVGSKHASRPDVICGGFPCQDLSVAGRRAGLDGERSGLWFEFLRVLEEISPGWVVIENVPGLLSSNGGRDFAVILRGLVKCGYGVCWRVLDSKYFGLAQRRKRVFIVGHLGDGRAAEVLFEREGVRWNPPLRQETGKISPCLTGTGVGAGRTGNERNEAEFCIEVAGTLKNSSGCRGYGDPADNPSSMVIAPALDTSPYADREAEEGRLVVCGAVSAKWAKGTGGFAGDECYNLVTHALTAEGSDASEDGTGRGTPIVFDPSGGTTARCNPRSDYSDALDASGPPAVWHENKSGNLAEADMARSLRANASHSYQRVGVRRLTPVEFARLQGFPDDWNSFLADSARYRQFGNAVSVPVAEWIGRRIMEVHK